MADESKFFGVSFRGIIAFMVMATICYMGVRMLEVKEPLRDIAFLVVGAYFGRQALPNGNGNGEKKNEPSPKV